MLHAAHMSGKAQTKPPLLQCPVVLQMAESREPEIKGRGEWGHEHAFQRAKGEASGVLKPFDTEHLKAQHHTCHLGWWEAVLFLTLSKQTWAG